MCLVGFAIDAHRRFPLVVAANRDEFFERPTARLGWWSAADGGPEILGGRDLAAGGTWLGLTAAGRLALVTNVRKPGLPPVDAPSRGGIVPLWLTTPRRPDQFWMQVALSGYAPFNLIAADFRAGDCFWASSEAASPRRIERGILGLSNGGLDAPWPKVTALKARMAALIPEADDAEALANRLFEALADRQIAPDAELPATGIGLPRERVLSPAFIRTPDGRYGTRCSTVIITERVQKRLVTHVFERSFSAGPGVALLRRAALRDWPPRYAQESAGGSGDSPVDESEVAVSHDTGEMPPPPKRTRVRSLLKPLNKVF